MEALGIWIAAILTLAIFSFLYKDNIFYKVAEYLFVGVSAGYWLAYSYHNVILPNLIERLAAGNLWYIIPAILSVFMICRLIPNINWISRWSISFVVGTSAGINFITYLQSNALNQLKGTIISPEMMSNTGTLINGIIVIIGTLAGLVYFFFSKPHKGIFGATARLGIWFLMISFGAAFGYTVMARISLLIGRAQFLLGDWLGLIP